MLVWLPWWCHWPTAVSGICSGLKWHQLLREGMIGTGIPMLTGQGRYAAGPRQFKGRWWRYEDGHFPIFNPSREISIVRLGVSPLLWHLCQNVYACVKSRSEMMHFLTIDGFAWCTNGNILGLQSFLTITQSMIAASEEVKERAKAMKLLFLKAKQGLNRQLQVDSCFHQPWFYYMSEPSLQVFMSYPSSENFLCLF